MSSSQDQPGREAERLLAMDPEEHLGAAALERASNQLPGEDPAAHEQRAQTHLLWAIAGILLGANNGGIDVGGSAGG